jgi:homoserine trans-succinylase
VTVEQKKSYYAIIPANVRYDKSLPANAKLLYGEITALCNAEGYCWASNAYFADLYGVSKKSVSGWIGSLAKRKYISIDMKYKEGTAEILDRYIRICGEGMEEKFHTPMEEKVKENNTSFNNTSNNTKNKRKQKPFSPPTLEEVEKYCRDRNNGVDAKRFYDYFATSDWVDSKGNKVRNWKQKVITWEGYNTGKQPKIGASGIAISGEKSDLDGVF